MISRRRIILIGLSVTAGVVAFFLVPKPLPELSRLELIAEVKAGNVHEVVVVDREVITGVSASRGAFRVVLRRGDNSLIDLLSSMGIEVRFEKTAPGLI
jgi:hypothetical protein